jgi:hypothetical protein
MASARDPEQGERKIVSTTAKQKSVGAAESTGARGNANIGPLPINEWAQ